MRNNNKIEAAIFAGKLDVVYTKRKDIN